MPSPPRLDQPRQGLRGPAPQPAAGCPQHHPVVGDQAKSLGERAQGQVALARTRRALDQDAAPQAADPPGDQARVDSHSASGKFSTNIAPITSPDALMRFSAVSVPPWASAICRAMERPRPELPPKAVPLGREV
jgi:hypothetical protein